LKDPSSIRGNPIAECLALLTQRQAKQQSILKEVMRFSFQVPTENGTNSAFQETFEEYCNLVEGGAPIEKKKEKEVQLHEYLFQDE